MVADVMTLTLLKPLSKFNVDIILSSTQRFVVPIYMSCLHVSTFAVFIKLNRKLPVIIVRCLQKQIKQTYFNISFTKKNNTLNVTKLLLRFVLPKHYRLTSLPKK